MDIATKSARWSVGTAGGRVFWRLMQLAFTSICISIASLASAAGPTAVSGDIGSNTTWSAVDSPFVLSGNVEIINGALLTVQPGVVVRMNADAAITVVDGALSAQGLSDQAIVFTSVNDSAGSAVSAAPGDWQGLHFGGGTIDASSTLSHVQVRFGHGLTISAASPTLDDVDIVDNVGAAIGIDLASSPRGRNITAARNDINGILVPAGSISDDVTWHLTGIPYVVAQGVVEVGLTPFGFEPATLELIAGETRHLTLNIPVVAPAGGATVALASSNAAALQVASTAIVAPGQHAADVVVSAASTGDATASVTLSASAAAYGSTTAAIDVLAHPRIALDRAEIGVAVSRSARLNVSVPPAATAAHAVVIDLASSSGSATVAAQVTIAQGTSSAEVVVTGAAAGSAILTAQSAGFTAATSAITVHALALLSPPVAFVAPGANTTITLTLSDPAPDNGLVISIQNDNPTALTTPNSVSVPAGAMTVDVAIGGEVDTAQAVDLEFSAYPYTPTTTAVSVQGFGVELGDGSDILLPQGNSLALALSLSRPAPEGGLRFDIGGALAGQLEIVPTQVTVNAGSQTSNETVTLTAIAPMRGTLTLTSLNVPGINGSVAVQVTPAVVVTLSRVHQILGKGLRSSSDTGYNSQYATQLKTDSPSSLPIEIDIANSDSTRVGAPTHISIPAGAASRYVVLDLVGLDTTVADVELAFSVTTPGATGPAPLSVAVVQSELHMPAIDVEGHRATLEQRQSVSLVRLTVPDVDGDPAIDPSMSPAGGTLRLSVVDGTSDTPSTLLDGIYPDATSTTPIDSLALTFEHHYYGFYLGIPQAGGEYRVKAELAGVGTWFSAVQHVDEAHLRFVDSAGNALTETALGKGLSQTMRVQAYLGGNPVCLTGSAAVSVASSVSSQLAVSNVIQGCGGSAQFQMSALATTPPDAPATISASATGAAAAALQVSVAPAKVRFEMLAGVRSLGSYTDDFHIVWDGDFAVSDADVDVDLGIAGETPANVLSSPEILDVFGAPNARVTMPAGQAWGVSAFVSAPTARGVYQLSANVVDGGASVSDVQTVATSAVGFDLHEQPMSGTVVYPVGHGLMAITDITLQTVAHEDDGRPGSPMRFDHPVDVTLVSRAPDLVQFVKDGVLSGTVTVAVPAGQSSISLGIAGLNLTDTPVQIDAYVGDDQVIAGSVLTQVLKSTLSFGMAPVRPVDDVPSYVQAVVGLRYRCADSPEPEGCSPGRIVPMPGLVMPVETFAESGAPVVSGFQNDAGIAVDALTFSGGYYGSDTIYADLPTGYGTYRVRASLDGDVWESDPVVVGGERSIELVPMQQTVGLGMTGAGAYLTAKIGDFTVVFGSDSGTATAACTDAGVCTADNVEIAPGDMYVPIPIRPLQAGSTTLEVNLQGHARTTDVVVAKPSVAIDSNIFNYCCPPPPLAMGPNGYWTATVRIADEFASQTFVADVDVQLSSEPAGVIGTDPTSQTLVAGQWWATSGASLIGLSPGTARIKATSPMLQTSYSAPFVVVDH